MTGAREERCCEVGLVTLGGLALLPFFSITALDWLEYCRLWLVTLGLGYLLWRQQHGDRSTTALWGLVFVFILNQFAPSEAVFYWGSLGLAVIAAVAGWTAKPRLRWSWMDWVAVGVGVGCAGISVGFSMAAGKGIAWKVQAEIAASVLVWLAGTRMSAAWPAKSRKLGIGVLGVFALVSVAGAVQLGEVYSLIRQGGQARQEGDLVAAVNYYQKALALSNRLELEGMQEDVAFSLASAFFAQGEEGKAAAVLGLEEGLVQRVPADAWKGPEGGNLYYLVSCWEDLTLYPGEVEIRIFARGTPALNVWPLMRVKLGEKVLGDLFVTSQESTPYSFLVQVPTKSQQRLEISFLNDYYQADPYLDRNLWIEEAEIHYRHLAWE